MQLLYHLLLFLMFFVILFISIRIGATKKLWIIALTALVLYGVSELSSFLKSKWFPSIPNMIVSSDKTRGLQISEKGEIQTAILKPVVVINSAKLQDARNDPRFTSQPRPFLYALSFDFDVINGIENETPLILKEALALFDINGRPAKLVGNFAIHEVIQPKSSKRISTNSELPLFIAYNERIDKFEVLIQCKFENHGDIISKTTDVSVVQSGS